MSKPVRLAREARAELHEAARRYGEERPELRIEFLAAVDEAMERMVSSYRPASVRSPSRMVGGTHSPGATGSDTRGTWHRRGSA